MATRPHWLLPAAPYPSYGAYRDDRGGSAVDRARTMQPEAIVDLVHRSGLRGRGGAGFPTGVKWGGVARHACPTRYVVCNAAEGEPGTFKDRQLLRYNPYAPIEGIVIAARAVGAAKAFIAIKASFAREIARLRSALDEMKAALGSLEIAIVEGPEEYLFGEEKAMLNVIEGEGPFPREADEPPYEHGLFATATSPNPTLANNVETLARVPGLLVHGVDSFRALGTSDTPGTLLFTLSGDLARPGVYEVEAGIPLRQLFERHGGGARPGRTLRAALSGVSTGVLTAEQWGTPADFGSLAHAGGGLGSAGFVVVDDQTSIPRVAQTLIRFLYVESCNQCFACKAELRAASRALDAMFGPKRSPSLLEDAVIGAKHAPQGNRCYLPVEASMLLPSLVRRFRGEFDAVASDKRASPAAWALPKLVDYDEARHAFTNDELQPRKQPNWTYAAPPQPAPSAARPSEPRKGPPVQPPPSKRTPPVRARGTVHVRINDDVAEVLHELAQDAGTDVEQEVDRILRAAVKRKHP